ncbi:hypothetical protein [Acidovorax sp. A1169]|uniref:hypothetical protein n=1 Tax=Acidovorax sp. A1169 TaxID=3059524 RepID=UPI002737E9F1|nr:hypothetical protein [Acidovorax sp. A1169]MDP4078247.1 hypothetical protein [Acidovorax sp. A1169]
MTIEPGALNQAHHRGTTLASLAAPLTSMGEIDFGGFRVDFSKGNVGSRYVDIGVIGSDGRLRD